NILFCHALDIQISTKIFHIRVTGHWVKSTLVNLGRWSRDYLIGSFGIGLRGLLGLLGQDMDN
ncbi:hypothetical protein Tco_1551552, partial [Tanacetum coccineum]